MSATDLVFDIFAIDRASAVFSRVGREAEGAGAAAERGSKVLNAALLGAGAVTVAFGAKAVEMAGNFQMSLSKLTTTAGEIPSNMALVSSGIESMAGKVGYSVQDLANAMYYVESGGYHGATGLKVLTAAAEAARIEGSSVVDTAHALTGALNDYHGTTLTATEATNAMTAAVGHGMMTFQDLAEAMPRIGARAAAAHVTFAEMLAALGTMTKDGLPASVAATYLGQSIGQLAAPTAKARTEMKGLGIDATAVAATITSGSGHGLGDAIEMLYSGIEHHLVGGGLLSVDTFKKMSKSTTDYQQILAKLPPTVQTQVQALATMAGGVRSFQGVLMLGGAHADQYRETLKAVTDQVHKGGTQVAGWKEIQGNFNQKLAEAKGAASALAVEFGTDLMPAASVLIGGIQSLTGFMAQNQQLFIELGTVAVTAAGSLLVLEGAAKAVAIAEGIAATASDGFGISTAFTGIQLAALSIAEGEAATGLAYLSAAMDATPFGLVALAIGGVTAGIMALTGAFGSSDSAQKRAQAQAQATRQHITDLANSYSQLNGAVTASTRNMILSGLQKSGAISAGATLGITPRTLIDASLGQTNALAMLKSKYAEVSAALEKFNKSSVDYANGQFTFTGYTHAQVLAIGDETRAMRLLESALGQQTTQNNAAAKANREHNLAVNDLLSVLKGVPGAQAIVHGSLIQNASDLAALALKYHWTAAQIRQVINAEWVPTTVRGVEQILQTMRSRGPDANAAGAQVGHQMGAGIESGIGSMVTGIADAAANAIHAAEAAAKKAGQIHSPSRVFQGIGGNLIEGLVVGITDKSSAASRATADAVRRAAQAAHRAGMEALHVEELQLGYALSGSKTALSEINKEITTAQQWASSFKDNVFTAQLTMPTAWETLRVGGMNVRAQTGGGALPANASPAQTLAAMIAYERKMATQNGALAADIRTLRAKGLSQLALDDIKGSGKDSISEIAALAGASKSQIALFNKLEAQSQNSLYNAGAYATSGTSYSTLLKRQESREDITAAIERALRGVKFTIANGGRTMRVTG